MKVYIVIDEDETDSHDAIKGVFMKHEDAIQCIKEFRSNQFHHCVQTFEVIE